MVLFVTVSICLLPSPFLAACGPCHAANARLSLKTKYRQVQTMHPRILHASSRCVKLGCTPCIRSESNSGPKVGWGLVAPTALLQRCSVMLHIRRLLHTAVGRTAPHHSADRQPHSITGSACRIKSSCCLTAFPASKRAAAAATCTRSELVCKLCAGYTRACRRLGCALRNLGPADLPPPACSDTANVQDSA